MILCVLKSGGVYTPEYVERLYESVQRHGATTSKRLPFVCLTDIPDQIHPDIPVQRFHRDWPGWWSKMNLFWQTSHMKNRPHFYFDLDTVIHDNIRDLLSYGRRMKPGTLAMLQDFTYPGEVGSGVMVWRGCFKHVFNAFSKDPDGHMTKYTRRPFWGDQDFIRDHCGVYIERIQDHVPGLIGSFKVGHAPLSITCYHGTPKPHETNWAARRI